MELEATWEVFKVSCPSLGLVEPARISGVVSVCKFFCVSRMSSRYSGYVARENGKLAAVQFLKTMNYLMENLEVHTCFVVWVKERCGKMPPPKLVL